MVMALTFPGLWLGVPPLGVATHEVMEGWLWSCYRGRKNERFVDGVRTIWQG